MKRVYLAILISVATIFVIYMISSKLLKGPAPADFLPEETIIYLEMDSPGLFLERFRRSRLWRQVEAIDWPLVLQEFSLSKDQIASLANNAAAMKDFYKSPLFKELFHDQVVVALVASSEQPLISVEDVLNSLVIIVRPRHNALILDKLTAIIAKGGYLEEEYQGINIKTFKLEKNRSVAAAIIDELLIVSFSATRVKECLDIGLESKGRTSGELAAATVFRELKTEDAGKQGLFVFADTGLMTKAAKSISKKTRWSPASATLTRIESMHTRAIALAWQSGRDVHRCRITLNLDPEKQGVLQSLFIDPVSVTDRVSVSMPADFLLYSWTNWFDMKSLWRVLFLNSQGSGKDIARNAAQWLRQKTGHEPGELWSMFGDEFGLFVSGIKTSGFFPVPSISLCFEVEDRQGVRELLNNTLTDLTARRNIIAGVPVISIMVAGGLMQPSYVFLDRCLLVADSLNQIESILNVDKNSLEDDADFQKMSKVLRKSTNLTLFARTEKLNNGLQELVSWVGTIIAIRDVNAGEKSKFFIDKVILPIMDGLKMYQLVGVSGFHQDSNLILETAVVVEQ